MVQQPAFVERILSSRTALDTPRLSRAVDVRIIHKADKKHMQAFRNTTQAEMRMYYDKLTPNDVQARHEDFGGTEKSAATFQVFEDGSSAVGT